MKKAIKIILITIAIIIVVPILAISTFLIWAGKQQW